MERESSKGAVSLDFSWVICLLHSSGHIAGVRRLYTDLNDGIVAYGDTGEDTGLEHTDFGGSCGIFKINVLYLIPSMAGED